MKSQKNNHHRRGGSKKEKHFLASFFNTFSTKVTHIAGSPISFILAFVIIIIWGITGPVFKFSDTWQLVINTGTTIITFLMVFIIQQTQNKDTLALQLKLNELIAANEKASNRLVDIEDLTEEELEVLKRFYIKVAEKAKKERDLYTSHSLDEAEENERTKAASHRKRKEH
jgi:low affinity Fe/Cu permease